MNFIRIVDSNQPLAVALAVTLEWLENCVEQSDEKPNSSIETRTAILQHLALFYKTQSAEKMHSAIYRAAEREQTQ